MQRFFKLIVVFSFICLSEKVVAEEIKPKEFETSSGECSPVLKKGLQEAGLKRSLIPYLSYTIASAPLDRRRGASPPTGKILGPLTTVMCIAKERNKILVTSTDPLDKSCGWVDEKHLSAIKETSSLALSNLSPCGSEIQPMTVGSFCAKIAKFGDISPEAFKLTRFCELEGVNQSTIDTKFVTDNTTSRLFDQSGINQLVKRKIPLFLKGDSNEVFKNIDIFSLNEVHDVFRKDNGDLRILLGKNSVLKGWSDISSGHVWYSNLSVYFSQNGNGKVYMGEIVGSQVDSRDILAIKPPAGNFEVAGDYAKFPVLFDMRKRYPSAPPTFTPQLQIAFIGKFCEEGGNTMCAESDNIYNVPMSNLLAADVVFLIDGSKSMKEYFKIVADSLSTFTTDYVGNPDYKFGVAMYGDFKSASKTKIGDPIDFKVIRDLQAVYSGDFQSIANVDLMINDVLKDKAEAVHAAVFETARSFSWTEGKPHFIIHIADHGDRQNPSAKVFNELEKNNIFYIPIAVEGEAILKESDDFITQSEKYFLNYRTQKGNPMAVKAIVSYGKSEVSENNIATALISATNVVSSLNPSSKSKGSILPTLGPAVRERFKIPSSDDIETLAAIGNIETAKIGDPEKNWEYFVTLDSKELYQLYDKTDEICFTLDSGDSTRVATDAILSIVQILTGDKKSPEELRDQLMEGSIPLQTATIIGEGMSDFMLRATTGDQLDYYLKEFCRTNTLIESMQRNRKIKNPEEGKDLVWDGDAYKVKRDFDFKWAYKDELGQEIYYVPIEYLPRTINQ